MPIAIIIAYERQLELNNLYPNNTLYISELAVKYEYRNKGIAKQLLENWFRINVNLY
jgi:ribosomal protein S18 acetylase RimI-like enzyme